MKKNMMILLSAVTVFLISGLAFAEGGEAAGAINPITAIASGIGIGIAVFGGALGQSKAAAAAFEGISRNPSAYDKLFVPFILGLALIESLVILAFLVTFVKLK